MKRIAMAVVAALALSAGLALAQDSLGVRCLSYFAIEGGTGNSIAVKENHAYLADLGNGLMIFDISNQAQLRHVATFDTSSNTFGVDINENFAYLANYEGDLTIIDISDPAHPSEVGIWDTLQVAMAVKVVHEHAFVLDWNQGLFVIDVSDPAHPNGIGFCNLPRHSAKMILRDEIAFIADFEVGLRIIDVSDPTNPHQIGIGGCRFYSYGIAVVGEFAYLASPEIREGGASGGYLTITRISDLTQPQFEGALYTPGRALDVSILGDFAFIADYDCGLRVVNVSDPARPYEVGYYITPGHARGVCLVGDLVLVACSAGLGIYDCSEAMGVQPAGTPVLPNSITVSPAFPNPFNSRATVGFTLPRPGVVNFGLFDQTGRQVRRLESSGWFLAGSHQIAFNADGLPSGGYFIQIQTGENVLQQRVVLIK